ncbi:hypothetical protein WR25_09050 [Diploscapter pachys]|uniref:Uncharacterized protein n=1 Tax=Diploscapter pachys TaxID=2018661 RepID=A0A2A2K691_9BILA|nr:hypothetical protein WR25_09050 [Diploscapter pachys]
MARKDQTDYQDRQEFVDEMAPRGPQGLPGDDAGYCPCPNGHVVNNRYQVPPRPQVEATPPRPVEVTKTPTYTVPTEDVENSGEETEPIQVTPAEYLKENQKKRQDEIEIPKKVDAPVMVEEKEMEIAHSVTTEQTVGATQVPENWDQTYETPTNLEQTVMELQQPNPANEA